MTSRVRRLAPLAMVLLAGGCRKAHLPPRGDAAAVVVLSAAPAGEPGVAFVQEQEPNDTRAAAMLLTLPGEPPSTGVFGTLAAEGADQDLFKLVIPGAPGIARRLIVAVTSPAGVGTSLQLQNAAGQPLLTSTGAAGERHGFPNVTAIPAESYVIKVRTDGPASAPAGSRDYRLTARVLDFESGDEKEPNDSAATATPMAAAETNPEVAGFFGGRKDEDWYRVPVRPAGGSALQLELDGCDGVTASVTVVDAAGTKVATARGRRSDRVVLRDTMLPAGTEFCFVVVRTEAGRNLDQRYVLRVSVSERAVADAGQGQAK